jgi:multiple sugar transport system permease protein
MASATTITGGPSVEVAALLARARRRHRVRQNLIAWLFILPEVVFFVVFLLVPVGWLIRETFYDGGVLGPAVGVGLANWTHVFSDPTARAALGQTLLFVVTIVPAIFILALAVSCLLRPIRRGASLLRAAVYFPVLIPTVAAAEIWRFMIHPDFGLLNIFNRSVGLAPINFIGSASAATVLIILFEVWRGVGYWTIFILAAMLTVPRDRYEAAQLDGASPARRFWHVTLPGIRWPLAVAIMLSTVAVLQLFDSVFILTDGGPVTATQTVVLYAFNSVFLGGQTGYGAVLSLVVMFMIVILTAVVALAFRARLRNR